MLPEVLVQLRNQLVPDAECVNELEGNMKPPTWRGGGGPAESSGHGMQEEIRRELGKPHELLDGVSDGR